MGDWKCALDNPSHNTSKRAMGDVTSQAGRTKLVPPPPRTWSKNDIWAFHLLPCMSSHMRTPACFARSGVKPSFLHEDSPCDRSFASSKGGPWSQKHHVIFECDAYVGTLVDARGNGLRYSRRLPGFSHRVRTSVKLKGLLATPGCTANVRPGESGLEPFALPGRVTKRAAGLLTYLYCMA